MTARPLPYQPPVMSYTYLGTYLLTEHFEPVVAGRRFKVPAGTTTDLATTPRFLWWWLPPTGIYEAAAVLHDWLCTKGIELGLVTSREADAIFRDMMGEAGVGLVRRWLMWTGVRWASLFSKRRRSRELVKDLPWLLPISAAVLVAASPFIAAFVLGVVELVQLAI